MLNKAYSVREITLNRVAIEAAIQEYIEKHNTPQIAFPNEGDAVSFTYRYDRDADESPSIAFVVVKLIFKGENT